MSRIDWRVTDEVVRAHVNEHEVGVVRHKSDDSLFYEAVLGDQVVCTTNLPFEAMRVLEDHAKREHDRSVARASAISSTGKGA